ncbi:MAG: LPS export ABC transporter permease LptF [Thioalkalivibrionaceae bacterium]
MNRRFLTRLQLELARQYFWTQTAVLAVATLIIVAGVTSRVLREVADGRVPLELLPWLLAFGVARAVVLLWPAALFLAVIFLLGRWARDNEWVAMQAMGQGEARVLGALSAVAVPVAFVIALAMHFVLPPLERAVEVLRVVAVAQSDDVFVAPGRFHVSRGGDRVLFVERRAEGNDEVEQVLLFAERAGASDSRLAITVARAARRLSVASDGVDRLELIDGERWVLSPGGGPVERLEFERMRVPMPVAVPSPPRREWSAETSVRLWAERDEPAARAELAWRFALPMSVLVMVAAAVRIARVPPRSSRYRRLPLAILVYVVYANLLLAAKGWLASGLTPAALGLWWVHVPVLGALLLVWLAPRIARRLAVRRAAAV